MYVYIAHAEADQAAATELKAFLNSRGLLCETETGASGYRHLQPSDVVVGMWSQKTVFDGQRMAMEGRMLDAWADGRLVLVKLDHGVLPVGLRDLPATDASFENNRDLAVWPQVERAARDAMNRALAGQDMTPDGAASRSVDKKISPQTHPARKSEPPIFTGFARLLLLAAAVICVGAAIVTLTTDLDRSYLSRLASWGILWVAALSLVVWIAPRVVGAMRGGATAKRSEMAGPAATAAAPGAPDEASVFVSYSHADDTAVGPVVKAVEDTGRTVWIDKGRLHPGDSWAGEIVRGIRAAKSVMVMCSPRAFESDHIKREVYLADRYKKPMVPVFLEAAKPPEDFEYFFATVQWLELFKLPEADRPAAIGKALAAV